MPDAADDAVMALTVGLMEMFRSHGHRVVAEPETRMDGLPQEDYDEILSRGGPRAAPTAVAPVVVERRKKRWRR